MTVKQIKEKIRSDIEELLENYNANEQLEIVEYISEWSSERYNDISLQIEENREDEDEDEDLDNEE